MIGAFRRIFVFWNHYLVEQKSNFNFILKPLSFVYGFFQTLHARAARAGQKRAPLFIISLGSPRVGGSGKSPMARAILQHLNKNYPSVILSRGYGGNVSRATLVDKNSQASEVGDEPLMLSGLLGPSLPVVVAKSRLEGAKFADKLGMKVALLDDGMQHYKLFRNLELALVSEEDLTDHLLPFGRLREPISSLKRCSYILAYRYDKWKVPSQKRLKQFGLPIQGFDLVSPHLFRATLSQGGWATSFQSWQWAKGKRFLSFAGIARPDLFFRSLQERGLEIVGKLELADHEPITYEKLRYWINQYPKECFDGVVTTEKDICRLNRVLEDLDSFTLYYPSYEVAWQENKESFFGFLEAMIQERA